MLQPSDYAWIGLGLGVAAYEATAADGQLMSEAADRYLLRHPWLVRGVAFMLAAHVCNMVKPEFDPLYWLFLAKRRLTT